MRNTSLLLLCIALCTTMILPVSAKNKGGGQSPTIVNLDEEITYSGPAKVHDTKRSFSVSIGVEGKKQTRYSIVFSERWPPPFGVIKNFDSYKTFITIYINKDDDIVRLSVSHESAEGHSVIKGTGTYTIDSEEKMHIYISKVTDLGGNVIPIPNLPLYFTLTY